ncbi:MAG: DNA primase [Lachnospiraceae bacterium]|nr:DNA primase [Lachnospiraceae bacterium]
MRIPDETVQEILEKTDIVELIGSYVRLKRSGSRYTGLCPFHNEKTPSFSVEPNKQLYYCFGCHKGGTAVTFLMDYHNYTFQEAMQELADHSGVALPKIEYSREEQQRQDRRTQLLAVHKAAAQYYYHNLKSANGSIGLSYLHKRGLTNETITRFGLGYADKFGKGLYRFLKEKQYSDEILRESGLFLFDEKRGAGDKFWNRVMFPIMDERNHVIGFGGRVMGDGKPKYLNSPETDLFNKRLRLYALNYARASKEPNLILCEGYMDVITMHQAGFTNACASLGTALTEEQVRLIKRFKDEVLLIYDSDSAGINAALRAIPMLEEAKVRARIVDLSPHKDPDEFIKSEGAEAFRERLDHAISGKIFEIDQLAKQYRLSEPDGMTAFQQEAGLRIVQIPDSLERENYIQAVSRRYRFSEKGFRELVGKLAGRGYPAESYRQPKKSGVRNTKQTESGETKSERLMLNFLASYPEAYEQTAGIFGPKDFQDPVCRSIAEVLYPMLEAGNVSESVVVSSFTESAVQSAAAEAFHAEVPVKSNEQLDQAFTDVFLRIASASNDAAMRALGEQDAEGFVRLMEQRKKIENLKRDGTRFHLKMKET